MVSVLAWLLSITVGSSPPKCKATLNVAVVTNFTEPTHEQKRRNELMGNMTKQLLSVIDVQSISQWPLSYDEQVRGLLK